MHPWSRSLGFGFFTCVLCVALLLPPKVHAASNLFGGKVGVSIPCIFNFAIWGTVSAPRGGIYIQTPFTRLYAKGNLASGKYVVGRYGIPYFCIEWIAPLFVIPGTTITMMGTS
jgi:hypothetical protein